MNMITISIAVLVLLIIAFILLGIWFKRITTSSEDFLLAGRKAPFWLMASAYLGGFVGGASVSGYVSLGYSGGISTMWTSLFVVSGCVAFILIFARRVNYFGRKTGAITLADFVCARYGESLRLPIAIFGFMRPGFLTGMQFLAIAVVIKVIFGLDLSYGIVISAVVVLMYLVTAGQYSAIVTQWIQSIMQSVGILLFAYITFKLIGNPNEVVATLFQALPPAFMNIWTVDFKMFTVWLLTFGVFYLADPWIYMWAYMGDTPKTSSNGMLSVLAGSYYNVLPFLSGLTIIAAVTIGKLTVPEGTSGDALYAWFTFSQAGTIVGVMIIVGLLMTIISCGSSFAMNGVTLLTNDIYHRVINKNATDKQVLFASRMSLVVVVAIGIASALWLPILVPLWSLAQAIGISGLLMPTMSAWFWKRSTTAGALTSSLFGGLTAFGWAVYAWLTAGSPGALVHGLHAAHVGLAVAIPLMIIVSLMTKPEYDKAEATNYKTLGEELKTSDLVKEKVTRPGAFGWLGADTFSWKVFWVIVLGVYGLHYILSFLFHVELVSYIMIWIALVVSALMIFMMAIMGSKDLVVMMRGFKSSQK